MGQDLEELHDLLEYSCKHRAMETQSRVLRAPVAQIVQNLGKVELRQSGQKAGSKIRVRAKKKREEWREVRTAVWKGGAWMYVIY